LLLQNLLMFMAYSADHTGRLDNEGSWVRIPVEAWMSEPAFIVCCSVADLRKAKQDVCRLCRELRNLKSSQGPTKDFKYNNNNNNNIILKN
jgi:hypothetical protein